MKHRAKSLGIIVLGSISVYSGCGPEFQGCEAHKSCAPAGSSGEGGENDASRGGMDGTGGTGGTSGQGGPDATSGGAGETSGDSGVPGLGGSGNSGTAGGGAAGATCAGESEGPVCGGQGPDEGGNAGAGGFTANPCESNPCTHGGACVAKGSDARCECPAEFTGPLCELPRLERIPLLAGDTEASARAINADGTVVVGYSTDTSRKWRSFRWQNGETRELGRLPDVEEVFADAVSGDGSVVVGYTKGASGVRAFRWQAGAMKSLPPLSGDTSSYARAVSSDGAIVVGLSMLGTSSHAVRWKSDGVAEDLGIVGEANAISGSGTVVVGSTFVESLNKPFRWEAGSSVYLAVPATPDTDCLATAMSKDALVVFGYCGRAREYLSYTWSGGTLRPLGLPVDHNLDPPRVYVRATNADGTMAVGAAWTDGVYGDSEAVVWDAGTGVRWLSAALRAWSIDAGLNIFWEARGISADGQTLAASGGPPTDSSQAWVIRMRP